MQPVEREVSEVEPQEYQHEDDGAAGDPEHPWGGRGGLTPLVQGGESAQDQVGGEGAQLQRQKDAEGEQWPVLIRVSEELWQRLLLLGPEDGPNIGGPPLAVNPRGASVALNGRVLASEQVGGPERAELRTFRWEALI